MLKERAFGKQVRDEVTLTLGEGYEVQLADVGKNNGKTLTGLTIKEEGQNVAPTIYLEEFEEKYEKGEIETIGDVAEEIVGIYRRHKDEVKELGDIANLFSDRKWVLARVLPRVINAERNKGLLEQIPHKDFVDLAVTYSVRVGKVGDSFGSIQLKNAHMSMLGLTLEELDEAASSNAEKEGFEAMNLGKMVEEMSEGSEISENDVPMMVLTNRERFYGAAVMTMVKVLGALAEKVKSDLYILPSSVNEVIVVPTVYGGDAGYLRSMVREVNSRMVMQEEVLSDSLYIYRRKVGEVQVA